MDGDRFDSLTRSLAGPRRAVLRAVAGVALGVLAGAPARLAGVAARRPATTCRMEQRPYDVRATFTTKLKKQKLSLTTVVVTPLDPQEDLTNTTTIKRGRKLLVRTEQTTAESGRLIYRTTYGAGFAGIAEVVLVVEGGTVGGEVDGRALVPFPANAIPATFAFQDGQPAPELRVSESTKSQVKQMLDRATQQSEECAPAQSQRARAGRAGRGGGVHAQGGDEVACLACKGRVFWEHRLCESGVYELCSPLLFSFFFGLGYAGCMAIGIYDCNDQREQDLRQCRESTNCCPERCGDIPDYSCCFGGRRCLTPSSNFGTCCEPGFTPCHERTCCAPGATCRPDGGCCPRGDNVCGNAHCCPSNQNCCNAPGFQATCCPFGQHCLSNGTCCRSSVMCNGTCCESGVCCGNICCQEGDFCDQASQRCGRTCGGNDVICPAGYQRDCCAPGGKCCPPHLSVPGGCCGRDQICCPGGCQFGDPGDRCLG